MNANHPQSATVKALVRRGMAQEQAVRLAGQGYTLSSLRRLSLADLDALGIDGELARSIGAEPPMLALRPTWLRRLLSLRTLTGAVAGFGLAATFFSILDTRRMAEKSGSLERPNLQVGVGKFGSRGNKLDLVLLAPHHCIVKGPMLIALPLTVANDGEKGAQTVKVTLAFPLIDGASPAGGNFVSEVMELNGPPVTATGRTVLDDEDRRYVTHQIDIIPARTSITFNEPILAPLPHTTDVDLPDGKGSIRLRYSLAYQVAVLVQDAEGKLLVRELNITAVEADSIGEAMPHLDRIASERQVEAARGLSEASFLWRAMVVRPNAQIFVMEGGSCPTLGVVEAGKVASLDYPQYGVRTAGGPPMGGAAQ